MLNLIFKKESFKKIIIVFSIFLISIFVRLCNLNSMGRTWDEQFYTQEGYTIINLIKYGDFSSSFWIKNPDEPIISKYFYGLGALMDYKGKDAQGYPVFDYDLFYTRLVSVLFGSLTVVLVTLFGLEYFSPFVSITAGLFFSLFPTYLGLTQRVTIESILVFFFTLSIYVFIAFLEKPSRKKAYFFGTLAGICCITKYSNVLIILLCFCLYFLYRRYNRSTFSTHLSYLNWISVGFLQLILIWPMPWLNISQMVAFEYKFRFLNSQSPWEWFFGFPIHVPWIYYIVYFFIRTPAVFLLFGFLGIYFSGNQKKWVYFALILWFLIPFIQSFYHFRMHGVRYIIQVYAPFSLLAAVGLEYFVKSYLNNKVLKSCFFILLGFYFFFILWRIKPYYLDYFNELVGGAGNVYRHNLFEIGWWGEGGREAGSYIILHANSKAKIGYKLNPFSTLLKKGKLKYLPFKRNKNYDFVVTNYYEYQKAGYNNINSLVDYNFISKNYNLVYTVYADGAELYHVYKNKELK